MPAPVIVALDFETANYDAHSACALAVVRLEGFVETARKSWLIRPPSTYFSFTHIHGLTWDQVATEPDFGEIWSELSPILEGADFLAAHNAPFDRGVMAATARHHGIELPATPYIDTVKVARKVWNIFPTKLNLVCERLGITLKHHEAMSDASAAAEILIRASAEGWKP